MRLTLLSAITILTTYLSSLAQSDSISLQAHRSTTYTVEMTGLTALSTRAPFWLWANQYGIIPTNSPAGLITASTQGSIINSKTHPNRRVTYGLEAVGIVGRQSTALLPQAYASLDLGKFSIWGGRKKEIIGLGDSTLSSGLYSWSGNALPITKIQVGTNQFTPLGFTHNIIAIHAFYAHGWFPNTDSMQNSFLHQKAFYIRVGKPGWKVRFTTGVLHNAQWGGHSAYLSKNVAKNGQLPSSFKDYLYVVMARQPDELESDTHTSFDGLNYYGNHLGSIDFGLEMFLHNWQAMAYYQHPFEDKSGAAFVNFPDGLYGIRLKRQPTNKTWRGLQIRQITLEHLTTMDQSGPFAHTGSHYDGQDDYFNHYQYLDGWTIRQRTIGTPFLTPRQELRPALQNMPAKYGTLSQWSIANNRVQMVYLGLAGAFPNGAQLQARLSYSRNYGTYRVPFLQAVNQFSGAVWVTWPMRWLGGCELRTAISTDQGELYPNALGGLLSLRKSFATQPK